MTKSVRTAGMTDTRHDLWRKLFGDGKSAVGIGKGKLIDPFYCRPNKSMLEFYEEQRHCLRDHKGFACVEWRCGECTMPEPQDHEHLWGTSRTTKADSVTGEEVKYAEVAYCCTCGIIAPIEMYPYDPDRLNTPLVHCPTCHNVVPWHEPSCWRGKYFNEDGTPKE